jgi:hypothetical protein
LDAILQHGIVALAILGDERFGLFLGFSSNAAERPEAKRPVGSKDSRLFHLLR